MNTINTALCSFGMSGLVFHAPFLNVLPQFNLYAVLERSKNEAEKIYPNIRTFRSLEEMLHDSAIELVIVNTPNSTHFEFAKKALLAGKHVIVEKPFTVNSKDAEYLIELAKKQNKLLSVYQNRRYDSDYKTVEKIITDHLLGDLVEVEISFNRYSVEPGPKLHKESPIAGAGVLFDLGSHLIDQALQLFGKPQAVFADLRIIRPSSQVNDYFELLFYYNKLRVRLKSSYLVREPLPGYILNGIKGSFHKSKTNIQEEELKKGTIPDTKDWGKEPDSERGILHTEINGKIIRELVPSQTGNYGTYYKKVYESIRNNLPLPVTAREGAEIIEIIEAAILSNERKKIINLNKEKIEF